MPERELPGGPLPDGPFKGKKIVLAGQDEVEIYQPEIDKILDVIGFPEALVTDLSSLGDFYWEYYTDTDDTTDPEHKIVDIEIALGVPIEWSDLLVDIASRMRTRNKD